MVPFGTENALSQKGTRARRLFRLGLTPLFLALVCPTPATLKKIRDSSQSTKSPKIYRRWYGGGKFVPDNMQTSVKFREFVEQYLR